MHKRIVFIAAAAVALACGADFSDPEPPDTVNNMKYTAEILPGAFGGISVAVTLNNLSSAAQSRTYPVSCAVRVRFYRLADSYVVYDEARRDCPSTPVATVTVDGLGTKQLFSGLRTPATVFGDSIQSGRYGVRALVATEGDRLVLVYAGVVDW